MVKQLKSLTFVNDNISNTYQVSSDTNPDWNQNDETAADYVKNRTHYTSDPVETELLEETSIETTGKNEGFAFVSDSITLVEGYTYLVTFNGIEYECVAYCDNLDAVIIGNGSLFGTEGGNGEPFACIFLEGYGCDLITQEAGTYTLKIVGMIPEVVKLPTKYLINSNVRNGEGSGSVVEGHDTTASGLYSHAESHDTTASGECSHAEGAHTTASGECSHAEGAHTTASGLYSHAEGYDTTASGLRSHAEGANTIASGDSQHVQGEYNIVDTENKYAHIVGNGVYNGNLKYTRSNAHTIDWNGLGWFAGGLKVGGTGQDDENAVEVATLAKAEEWVFELEDGSTVTKKVVLG